MAKGFHPFRSGSEQECHTEANNNNNNNTGTTRDSNMLARRSALNLPLSQMAIPIYTAPTREDVELGGRLLLQNFIHEEFEHEGLPDDVLEVENHQPDAFGDVGPGTFANLRHGATSPSMASTPQGYKNAQLIEIGSNIKKLAIQFAASHERTLVRQQADQVDLGHINQESFFNMLEEIFRNGFDRHCIVALFFFCSDVLIRCVKKDLREMGTKLFLWSMQFLVDRVCKWVYDHGGWGKVFSDVYNVLFKASAIIALGVFIACGVVWVKRNW